MTGASQKFCYCERCRKNVYFLPVRKDEDSGEVDEWECSLCELRCLDEPPEPRRLPVERRSKKSARMF